MRIEEITEEVAEEMGIQIISSNLGKKRYFIPYCTMDKKGCFQALNKRTKCPNYMEYEVKNER